MAKKAMTIRVSATKQELAAAMIEYKDDMAAVLFFLAGAEAAGAMFQGRSAADTLRAVARLMNVSPEAVDVVRRALA